MTGRSAVAAAIAGVGAVALLLAGCSVPPVLQDVIGGQSCTQVGLSEGVSVDMTNVLAFEGGDYQVALSLPRSAESTTGTLVGNSEGPLQMWASSDLDGEPVEVVVEARDPSGEVVYRGLTTATPPLWQPNGPRCDPKNYWLSLTATDGGELVAHPQSEPVRDEQGRVSMWVYTSCGVRYLDDAYGGGGIYVRVDGPLHDGAGGPPAGWAVPLQRGWVAVQGDQLVFEDERGHREVFRPWNDSDLYEQCAR